jgi:hypothetical protein
VTGQYLGGNPLGFSPYLGDLQLESISRGTYCLRWSYSGNLKIRNKHKCWGGAKPQQLVLREGGSDLDSLTSLGNKELGLWRAQGQWLCPLQQAESLIIYVMLQRPRNPRPSLWPGDSSASRSASLHIVAANSYEQELWAQVQGTVLFSSFCISMGRFPAGQVLKMLR